ncbi:MAG: hypothetical protein IJX69_02390, partial [Oscillospiraceae bacterium]|nr:hypothetical protein [Oscillospiraceae bacterium]
VGIPWIFRYVSKTFGDCHTSDIGHWFAMTRLWCAKIFSTGAVECGKITCGQFAAKNSFTKPVEKLSKLHTRLWMNFRCGSKANRTFPHNFPLLLLLLPKDIYLYIYFNISGKKEFVYALYL